MSSLKWCRKKIQIIEPNDNLAEEYLSSAEETRKVLKYMGIKSHMWLATTKYYAEYFAVYAMLMKIGIKSEIHDCTIAVANLLEKERILPEGFSKILEQDKELRIDNQYYLKNKEVKIDHEELVEFILRIKDKMQRITLEEKERVRKILYFN